MVGGGHALSGGRKSLGKEEIEKEDPHLPGRIWEDLPKPRFLPAGH